MVEAPVTRRATKGLALSTAFISWLAINCLFDDNRVDISLLCIDDVGPLAHIKDDDPQALVATVRGTVQLQHPSWSAKQLRPQFEEAFFVAISESEKRLSSSHVGCHAIGGMHPCF